MAIDDELPALEKLKTYINRVPYLELADSCDNAIDAGTVLASRNDIDAIFVDINMPDMNGLDFVEQMGDVRPEIVFITAYPQYALDSYRTGAVDYLLKPYDFEDFCRAAGRIVQRKQISIPQSESAEASANKTLFVKVNSKWVKIEANGIEYIRGYGDYLRIYVTNRPNPYVTYSTMASILEKLPENFIQVHRSYIVNMAHGVSAVERGRIITVSKEEIPIGDSYRENLTYYLAEHSL